MQLESCNLCASPLLLGAKHCHICGNKRVLQSYEKTILSSAAKILTYIFLALLLFLFLSFTVLSYLHKSV